MHILAARVHSMSTVRGYTQIHTITIIIVIFESPRRKSPAWSTWKAHWLGCTTVLHSYHILIYITDYFLGILKTFLRKSKKL